MELYSKMVGHSIKVPLGDHKGKLVDIVVDSTKRWTVTGLAVRPGLVKKTVVYPLKDVISHDRDTHNLEVSAHARTQAPAEHSARTGVYLADVKNWAVETSDGKPVGKVYDFHMVMRTRPWRVWKLLVMPKGAKARRLRIDTKDVERLDAKKIILDSSYGDSEE